jgi:hypothetical protein
MHGRYGKGDKMTTTDKFDEIQKALIYQTLQRAQTDMSSIPTVFQPNRIFIFQIGERFDYSFHLEGFPGLEPCRVFRIIGAERNPK